MTNGISTEPQEALSILRPGVRQLIQQALKPAEKAREMSLAARAWEREHGRVADAARYDGQILPRIKQ